MVEIKTPKEIFELKVEKENDFDDILERKEKSKPKVKRVEKIYRKETFDELKKRAMTDGYRKDEKGHSKFYIGTKDKVEGQITFIENEQKQKFILARIMKKSREFTDKDGNEVFYFKHFYFDEPISMRERSHIWDNIEGEFYLYKFETGEKTYQLFSTEKLNLGDYTIWGTEIEILDHVDMGNTAQIGKQKPLLFVHSAFSQQIEIKSHSEFFDRFKKYKLNRKKFVEWVYTSPEGWVYEFPDSFVNIQMANILACRDDFNPFHMPLLVISETGTGKTTATEYLFNKMNERQEYTDMTSSTLKGLIPSFKTATDLKAGLFLESRRYVPVDEFFAGVSNLHQDEKGKVMENIKNILDYKERAHRSGHGVIKGIMRADHIALTNPKSYGNNALQLSNHFLPENLARYLIWYIPNTQKEFIQSKKGDMKRGDFKFINKNDFLEGIDYLKTFNCDYDIEKIKGIVDIGHNFLKLKGDDFNFLKAVYSSRYYEHCCRLVDSMIKFRCWVESDDSFKGTTKDYDLVRDLWLEMLENWGIGFSLNEWKTKNLTKLK